MNLKTLLGERVFYLYVKEHKGGLHTSVNPDISRLHRAHKDQLVSFLKGVIEGLEKK